MNWSDATQAVIVALAMGFVLGVYCANGIRAARWKRKYLALQASMRVTNARAHDQRVLKPMAVDAPEHFRGRVQPGHEPLTGMPLGKPPEVFDYGATMGYGRQSYRYHRYPPRPTPPGLTDLQFPFPPRDLVERGFLERLRPMVNHGEGYQPQNLSGRPPKAPPRKP